jgi:hypothetical protein
MKAIPLATTIALTIKERLELEALAGSRKSEARMRDRARIVLLAASGIGLGAIAREVGCTPGTVSKWRVRFAGRRMAGLSETAIVVRRQNMAPSTANVSSLCWISPRRPDIPTGRRRCWRAN